MDLPLLADKLDRYKLFKIMLVCFELPVLYLLDMPKFAPKVLDVGEAPFLQLRI